jgi:hypothetical protein
MHVGLLFAFSVFASRFEKANGLTPDSVQCVYCHPSL